MHMISTGAARNEIWCLFQAPSWFFIFFSRYFVRLDEEEVEVKVVCGMFAAGLIIF